MEKRQLVVEAFGYRYIKDLDLDILKGKPVIITVELLELPGYYLIDKRFLTIRIVENNLDILK